MTKAAEHRTAKHRGASMFGDLLGIGQWWKATLSGDAIVRIGRSQSPQVMAEGISDNWFCPADRVG
jgi:hypothetical protein